MNARRLGSRRALCQPDKVSKETGRYCARSAIGLGGGGQTGQGFCSSGTQPAISTIHGRSQRSMWVVYIEIGLALALAAFIVWFTWPRKKK